MRNKKKSGKIKRVSVAVQILMLTLLMLTSAAFGFCLSRTLDEFLSTEPKQQTFLSEKEDDKTNSEPMDDTEDEISDISTNAFFNYTVLKSITIPIHG